MKSKPSEFEKSTCNQFTAAPPQHFPCFLLKCCRSPYVVEHRSMFKRTIYTLPDRARMNPRCPA